MGEPEDDEPKRLSYLVSTLVHSAIILVLISLRFTAPVTPQPEASPRILQRVRLVPPRVIPPPPPAHPATPATPEPRERISIGPKSEEFQKELNLERDVELTNENDGPGRPGPEVPAPGTARPVATPPPAPQDDVLSVDGGGGALPLPAPRPVRSPIVTGPPAGGLRQTLQNLDARIGNGEAGLAKGGGQSMGGLQFDARGADFTKWTNGLRREVYRNWIIPQPALLGIKGTVDIEFTVQRDGRVIDLRILKGSGVPALDRAAANSLLASQLLVLPPDYGQETVTMQARFYYSQDPHSL